MAEAASCELIGSEVSLYTGKVRAYLRYKRIPFRETLATTEVYRQVILPRTGVRFIPILITDDDVAIQDSTEIIDALEQRHPEPAVYPTTPAQRLVALLLEVYGDEWLVVPAMHYRWSYPENRRFAVQEFGRTASPQSSVPEQVALGEKLSGPFAGALPFLGITDETAPAIEQSYLAFLADFDRHLAQHDFLLGSRPSIGDFGLVGPLYAHLYRDPYSGDLMREHAPRVHSWVTRMIEPAPDAGRFVEDDVVPDTLLPILVRMFREQVPVILDTMRQLEAWIEAHPDERIPRSIGEAPFQVEGTPGRCSASPYRQWMWQRALDHYQRLSERERSALSSWLDVLPGARAALDAPAKVRVERRAHRLVVA